MPIFNLPLYESMSPIFLLVFSFVGALFGSFFNVLSQRWGDRQIFTNDSQAQLWMHLRNPKGKKPKAIDEPKSLMGGRSSCPSCSKPIPIYLNIPILSWVMLLGKSRCCESKIPFRYLAFEIAGASLFFLVGYLLQPSMYALILSIALMIAILIGVIDLKDGFIPDSLLVALLAISMALTTHSGHWVSSSEAVEWMLYVGGFVFIFFWLMSALAGRGVMGGADQYLLIVSASIQGSMFLKTLPIMVIGLVVTAYFIKSGKIERGFFTKLIDSEKSVPAGPAIVLSLIFGAIMQAAPEFKLMWF